MLKTAYYRTCDRCGSNLDPGERCDCDRKEEEYPARVIYQTPRDWIKDQRKRPSRTV